MMSASTTDSAARVVHTLYGETMGTRWRVCAVASPNCDLVALHARIQAPLDRVVAQMSTWNASSNLCRFNAADAGTWHRLPDEFDSVLRCALEVAEASNGAYDPTIGPLVDLWGFGPDGRGGGVPDGADIARAKTRVGWRRLLRDDARRALLQPGHASLDFSAIAKGFGVDVAVTALRDIGIDAALVDVGGELSGYGRKPDGATWRVLVEAAPDEDVEAAPCVITLDGIAVATSGDRWHAFDADGVRYAHTLDARSGHPVTHAACSVTVVATDAMHADAWATALTVMGVDAGIACADAGGIAARFVTRDASAMQVRESATFSQWRVDP